MAGRRLRAVTAAAGRAGVRAGMSVPEARALCASLVVCEWDDAVIAAEITAATAALVAGSPQVAPVAGAPGLWWVGASGFDALGGERALAQALRRIAARWHPRARVAVAGSCVAARAAAWSADGDSPVRIVPRGGDAAYLATAPLALVPMDDELREALVALGLRTVGALAALDAGDVERRWGAAGITAWRLARGDDPRRPVLAHVDRQRVVETELSTPAPTMEPVLFLVRAALDRLVRELVDDGRAAAVVAVTLTLDGAGASPSSGGRAEGGRGPRRVTREARLARPLARVAPLLERCRALLEQFTLDAPVCGVAVRIAATAPLSGEQGDLLAGGWHDPAAADAALARLRAELGPGTVVRPVSRDGHAPERAGGWIDIDDAAASGPAWGSPPDNDGTTAPRPPSHPAVPHDIGTPRPLTLRLLEAPEPIEVEHADDAPRAVRWRDRHIPLARAQGPERLAGDWWADAYRRDYWRCEGAADAADLLIYLDRGAEPPRWYLHGWYD